MKIAPITNKIGFGYKTPQKVEQQVFDGDDLSCQQNRKFIRERIFANFPYNEEHDEYRLDPEALKYLIIDVTKTHDIDKINREIWAKKAERKQQKEAIPEEKEFLGHNQFFDSSLIYDELLAYNKQCIADEIYAYRGSMVDDEDDIDILKRAGVKTIIDLRGGITEEKDGIKYFCDINTSSPSFWKNAIFHDKDSYVEHGLYYYKRANFSKEELEEEAKVKAKEWEREKAEMVDKLVKFVDLVNQGNIYIGCEFGTESTVEALCLNNAINPKIRLYGGNPDYLLADHLLCLLKNLNDDNKKRLGLTPEIYQQRVEYLTQVSNGKR